VNCPPSQVLPPLAPPDPITPLPFNTITVVRNAGHEVPFFQPVAALDMINRFLKNLPFD
jgi:hypothetical protein